jgi:hypothetical protein
MTTKKNRSVSKKKSALKAVKKGVVKMDAVKRKISKKPSAKPAAKKKSLPAKVSTKVTSKITLRHNKVANQALGFLDEAASLLRTGIREGAKATENSRIVAKKKAHHLLGKASKELSKAIEDGASTLQDLIKKI